MKYYNLYVEIINTETYDPKKVIKENGYHYYEEIPTLFDLCCLKTFGSCWTLHHFLSVERQDWVRSDNTKTYSIERIHYKAGHLFPKLGRRFTLPGNREASKT